MQGVEYEDEGEVKSEEVVESKEPDGCTGERENCTISEEGQDAFKPDFGG